MLFGSMSLLVSGGLTYNMFRNLKGRCRVEACPQNFDEILSRLTVVMPVRDELKNLKESLPTWIEQKTKPKRMIFLDDGSTDGSSGFLTQWCEQNSWMERVVGKELPIGWRGKVWALQQALEICDTEWILFVDADVRLGSQTSLAALWHSASAQSFGFFSVFPRPDVGLAASLLVHQIYTHLYYFLPYNAERLENSSAVAGCGQIMLMRTQSLRELGGFESLKDSTHDGLKLARLFRRSGARVVCVDGAHEWSCKMYPDFVAAFRGFSRNSYEATQSLPATVAICGLLLWIFVLPYLMLPFVMMNPIWALSFLITILGQLLLARELELGTAHVVLTPVKALASVGVHVWGAVRSHLKISSSWHGRPVVGG